MVLIKKCKKNVFVEVKIALLLVKSVCFGLKKGMSEFWL